MLFMRCGQEVEVKWRISSLQGAPNKEYFWRRSDELYSWWRGPFFNHNQALIDAEGFLLKEERGEIQTAGGPGGGEAERPGREEPGRDHRP